MNPPGTAPAEDGPPRILVVDDDRVTRLMMRHMLLRLGHPSELAADVAEASSALRAKGYDVLICDLQLPDGTGLDLVEILDELPAAPAFIMITGTAERQGIDDDRLAAVDHYLTKPVSSWDLETALREIAQSRACQDADGPRPARAQPSGAPVDAPTY